MPDQLLLVVESTLGLPGLGLLVFSSAHESALRRFPLHSHLEVAAHLPDGPLRLPATIEEVHRGPDAAADRAEYALLIDSDALADLAPGTELWLPEVWAEIYRI